MRDISDDCSVCKSGLGPEVDMSYANHGSKDEVYQRFNFSRQAVRNHLNTCHRIPSERATSEISIDDIDRPLASDAEVLALMGMSSDVYEIAPNTLNVSARTLSSGGMLYSYRARVLRKTLLSDEMSFDAEGWRSRLQAHEPVISKSEEPGKAAGLILGDQQTGKKATMEMLENWTGAVERFAKDTQTRIAGGENIDRILLPWGGDIVEGIANSYRNQAYASEMNLSTQIEVAYDTACWTFKYLIDELELPITTSWVPSNHGETWVREGGKDPITSSGDNIDTHIGRLVKSTFEKIPGYDCIDWVIADGNIANVFTVNGIKIYQTHNYKEKGSGVGSEARTMSAMQKQILGRPMELGDVKVFLTSHYHHLWCNQDRSYTVFGTPALEAKMSSEWLFEMSGVWSEPGALGITIDPTDRRGWNRMMIY